LPEQNVKPPKAFFSEPEAARTLGISVDEFRHLVKRYIVDRDEDMTNMPVTTYHASDLLVLKLIVGGRLNSSIPA
jgi:hypothetical protein